MQEKLAPTQLEDTEVILAAPGEMVVPPVVSESTQAAINADLQSVGLNPNDFVVGNGRINQITGLQQFGFLSDVFKKVKKVVKKVAPIAVSFIPGVGPVAKAALTAVAGKASGMDTKGALLAGLTAGAGAKFAGSSSESALKGLKGLKGSSGKFFGADGTFRNILGAGKEFILPGEDNRGLFKNIFSDRLGFGQMPGEFEPGNFQSVSNTQQSYPADELVASLIQDGTLRYEQGYDGMPSYLTDGKNKFYSGDEVMSAYGQQTQSKGLGFFRRDPKDVGSTPQIIKSIGDLFGFGGRSGLQDAYGGESAEGSFFGMRTPGPIRGIEDVFKGEQTVDSRAGLASLAALYGLAAKKAAEKTEGGLTDIRASRRPDLVAQPVFQGFDVGIRPGMAKGGLSPELFELDFRKVGGPTIGIGTGTSDDIPAMLSDGEYVMTADANNGAGGFKISKTTDSITLIPEGKPDREKGAKNLGMLMDMFEDANKRMA